MNETTEPELAAPAEKPSRLGTLLRWAARITSIPIFALLLVSLVPALANFGVAARDDKIMACGLCGIAAGFLAGWMWAGIGGLLTLAGVGVVLSQEEGGLAGDPFAVAFALQGILFLISWAQNASRNRSEQALPRGLWIKRAAATVLALAAVAGAAIILRGPAPIPLGREQSAYLGTWDNGAGFKMEISSEGKAKITQEKDAKVASCNTPLTAGAAGEFPVEFRDDRIELTLSVLGEKKTYHIDRWPFRQGKQTKMVLNGSDPYVRTNGMVLVKQETVAAPSEKPVAKTQPATKPAVKPGGPAAGTASSK